MDFAEFFGVLFMFAFLVTIVLMPLALVIADFRHFVKKKEASSFELVAFMTGGVYMFLGLVCWDMLGYQDFFSRHMIVIIVFAICGLFSYHKLKFKRKGYSHSVNKLLLVGMYAGMAVSVVWLARLSRLVSEEGNLFGLGLFCHCL